MLKFSDVIKTFLNRLYLLLLILLIVLGASALKSSVSNSPSLLDKSVYISQGELYVSPNMMTSSEELTNYMNRIAPRVKTPTFIDIVKNKMNEELTSGDIFAKLKDEDKETVKNLVKEDNKDIENNINIVIDYGKGLFVVKYANVVAEVSQAVNKVIINEMYTTLSNAETADILGGIRDNSVTYQVGDVSLPTTLTPVHLTENNSLSLLKVIVLSVALYVIVVVIYDFILGFINNSSKAKCMVNAEMVAEVEIPYTKVNKNSTTQNSFDNTVSVSAEDKTQDNQAVLSDGQYVANSVIDKRMLCAENINNCANYENFAMQILSKSTKQTDILAISSDAKKHNLIAISALNAGYNLACHDKKVLLINLDTTNVALNDLLLSSNDNDKIISYGNVDIILPKSTDFVSDLDADDLKKKYSDYDFVIMCVPSPKYLCNYLAVPAQTSYYMIASRYISSFYALNKSISKIVAANSNIVGSVYTKFKKIKQSK